MIKGLMVFMLALSVQPLWAQERAKIGFVDLQRAIRESQAGKRARDKFQAEIKKAESDLLKEKQELERMKVDLEKKSPLLRDEDRRNHEKELQRRMVAYNRSMRDSQDELRQRESEMTAEILKDLQTVVAEVGKHDKFTLILERSQVLYSDTAVDITPRVIELYNSRTAGKAAKAK